MKLRLGVALAVLALMVAAVAGFTSPANAAKPGSTSTAVGINGIGPNGESVVGQFNISRFAVVNGVVTALGTFVGTVNGVPTTQAGTAPVEAFNTGAAGAVVAQQTGSCQILDLRLGPLDLDVLGLVVHLDEVHLNITAQQGPGNLLGNLLCAVAGLLDNTGGGTGGGAGALQGIVNLLNQIIGILNGI